MKLIIAGGRDYLLAEKDYEFLGTITPSITEIVSGGCSGADRCGEDFARANDIPIKLFLADWNEYGRAAGPIRNRKMAEYADAVVLFPGGRGTDSMRNEAHRAKISIFERLTPIPVKKNPIFQDEDWKW